MTDRLYSLYKQVSTDPAPRRYERLSTSAYNKSQAVQLWQSRLIEGFSSGQRVSLRPIPKSEEGQHR